MTGPSKILLTEQYPSFSSLCSMLLVCSGSVISAIALRSLQQLRDTAAPPFTVHFSACSSSTVWATEIGTTHYTYVQSLLLLH